MSNEPLEPKVHDISSKVGVGTPVWPGDTNFELEWTSSLVMGQSSNVSRIVFSPHTGTHIDAPLHLIENGADSAEQALTPFLGPVQVINWVGKGMIDSESLRKLVWTGAKRVLFRTRQNGVELKFDETMQTLTPEGAEFLARQQILLVGVDVPSVDEFSSNNLPVHHILIENQIAILEGLELGGIGEGEYELIALPLSIQGGEASPVRAILRELA